MQAEAVRLYIYDVNGKAVKSFNLDPNKGMNSLDVTSAELGGKGLYFYSLKTNLITETRKMLVK